jgi:uncharacterized membrane protein
LSVVRDGAGIFEVQIRLQKAFFALATLGDDRYKASAARLSKIAIKLSDSSISIEEEKVALHEVARKIAEITGSDEKRK